jgi:hypothetical protein
MIAGTAEESSRIEGDSPVERLRQRMVEERDSAINGVESSVDAPGCGQCLLALGGI